MMNLYDDVSFRASKMVTNRYSTSFSLAILLIPRRVRRAIYAIYGFVRLADEIVDTLHHEDKEKLLLEFEADGRRAIDRKISMNPILQSFQKTVHDYDITADLIEAFLHSMKMDLQPRTYDRSAYETYIYGSAEVVGLMCLKVFTEGDAAEYERLKDRARLLGSAFQKVNFLRDLNYDAQELERSYFPEINQFGFTEDAFQRIYDDIQSDFDGAHSGIQELPRCARCGVYLAYVYYTRLFDKIKRVSTKKVAEQRIRIPNWQKMRILLSSYLKYHLNLI